MAWNAFGRFGGHAIAVRGGDGAASRSRGGSPTRSSIDFPSVAPAIERMRSALRRRRACEDADRGIEISPREAIEGATVPLDVPVRCTCRECGGRGETWTAALRGDVPAAASS